MTKQNESLNKLFQQNQVKFLAQRAAEIIILPFSGMVCESRLLLQIVIGVQRSRRAFLIPVCLLMMMEIRDSVSF